MALSDYRVHQGAETDNRLEQDAIDLVRNELPDVDPYHIWPLQELLDPTSGRLYEIDLLVIGKHALYLIEIKSKAGILTGDVLDWQWRGPQTRNEDMEHPYRLANKKAKVLATLLRNELPADQRRIWVEALVLLSNEELSIQLPEPALNHVIRCEDVPRALTHAEYRGADPRQVVNRPQMRALIRALQQLGLRPSRRRRMVGQYQRGELLAEGSGFQDHIGTHSQVSERLVRIRTYLVAQATTSERRAQLGRAARRELAVLTRLGEHPSILRCHDLVESAPRGPSLLFERFDGGIPLDQLLRVRPDLPFDQRVEILRQVADAIDFCHRQRVLHRALAPQTILVRERKGRIEVRLHSFQLASRRDASTSGTHHLNDLGDPAALVYRAPEVHVDPSKASELSDIWSLGAVAYFVLTNQPPATGLSDLISRLEKHGALHPGAVRDDLTQEIDELVADATQLLSANRADCAITWFNLLLEHATTPTDHGEGIDPHKARPGDRLDHGLVVCGELGSGASARVLRVKRGDRDLALKIPHDEGCVQRLRAEAEVLERLRHSAIVRCHGVLEVGGRVCLLLDYAGESTLARRLRQEGTFSLDMARRYGDDLLSALQHLEERRVQHRDVKPGNLGFTPTEEKKASHLLLFDFSLATLPAHQVSAGTPAYRDPSLPRRGAWDAAADRYAAAATLYEMLTGSRPETVESDTGGFAARVEAERFDAAVRDRMAAFFRRAFDPDAEKRLPSAEAMKTEWLALFAEHHDEEAPRPQRRAAVTRDDPVELLELGTRARNALDRAGVLTVRELLALPRNHLSAIRGVGVKVAKEIFDAAEELRRSFADTSDDGLTLFLPELPGRCEPLGEHQHLSPRDLATLADAALTTTADVARTPAARIERLLGADTAAALRRHLAEAAAREEHRPPLERWANEIMGELLASRPTSRQRRMRALLGLEPLPGSAPDDGAAAVLAHREVSDIVRACKVTRQLVYQNLAEYRKTRWYPAPSRDELLAAVTEVVDEAGGVLLLEDAAERLAARHGSGTDRPPVSELRKAAALLRIAAELAKPLGDQAPVLLRGINGRAWLARQAAHLDALRALAGIAEGIAGADELCSTAEVRERLQRAAAGTTLAPLPATTLVRLAAAAARRAALSARLELYPPGMPAERALRLSQSVLAVPELTVETLRKRVHERYPEAEQLPMPPELDRLVEPSGLVNRGGVYRRPGVDMPSETGTSTRLSYPLARADGRPIGSPAVRTSSRFDEALRSGLEAGRFRVLSVRADDAAPAAERLAEQYGLTVVSLDHALWRIMQDLMARRNVEPQAVIDADRAGPDGASWPLLCRVVSAAADELVDGLLADRSRPQLLVNPGLLARFNLSAALHRLVEEAEHGDGRAIVLLVPTHAREEGVAPSINETLPVPAPIPGQRLRIPESWLGRSPEDQQ